MKSYLTYVKWYSLVSVDRGKLDTLLKPPLYNRDYHTKASDPKVGTTFKLYDWCKRVRRNKRKLLPVVSSESDTSDFGASDKR